MKTSKNQRFLGSRKSGRFSRQLKAGLYNILKMPLGRKALKSLSKSVYAKNIKRNNKSANKNNPKSKQKKFLFSITIDTESGYVKKNNERVWQKSNPKAYIGYYQGIENWRKLLNKYGAKATFFLSTNCFSAKDNDLDKIKKQLKSLLNEKHEIGLHLHPDSDLALQLTLKEKFHYTSSKFYNYSQINQFIKTSKKLIKDNINFIPTSFRWGNWALNTDAVMALQENGFKVDSSATPGIKGHPNDGMSYDWSKAGEHYPWKLSSDDYQDTKRQNSKVLEIPIATFSFMGKTFLADPVYSELLKSAFDYYYRNADRSKNPFVFVVISHSIESTHEDGGVTQVIKDTEEFIKHAKKFDDVEFVTINEAYKRIK